MPRSVTWPERRASQPSSRSVAAATTKSAVATSRPVVVSPPSTRRAQAKNGTSAMRSTVTTFARFQAEGTEARRRPPGQPRGAQAMPASTAIESACDPPRPRRPPRPPSSAALAIARCCSSRACGAVAPPALRPSATPPVDRRDPTRPPHGRRAPTPDPDPDAHPDARTRTPSFTIVAAGDVLPPPAGDRRAPGPPDGYDFAPLLAPAGPVDPGRRPRAVPPRGAGHPARHRAVSGYPLFGTPAEIAASLAGAGLGRLLDGVQPLRRPRRSPGSTATLDALDAAGLGHVGTARSAVEQAAAAAVHARPRRAGRSRSRTSPRPTAPTACRSTPTSRGR